MRNKTRSTPKAALAESAPKHAVACATFPASKTALPCGSITSTRTVEVDGAVQRVWKADFVKVDHAAIGAAKAAMKVGKRHLGLFRLASASCTARLLLADRKLTYRCSHILPPAWVVAVDTEKQQIRMNGGDTVAARVSIANLSDEEALLVQYTRLEERFADFSDEHYRLKQENEALHRLAAQGYLEFSRRVEPRDFCCFIYIMAYGGRAKAAREMGMCSSTFYEVVASWEKRGPQYRNLAKMVSGLKVACRKGLVPLGSSLQSSGRGDELENPETNTAVLEQIMGGGSDQPQQLREVLELLVKMNPNNWAAIRDELVPIIKEGLLE